MEQQFAAPSTAIDTVNQFEKRFTTNAKQYTNRPTSQRQCTDKCCAVFFIICFLTFIIYSAISISTITDLNQLEIDPEKTEDTFLEDITLDQLTLFGTYIFICFGISIGISLILCGLTWFAADKAVYVMAILGFVGLLGAAVYLSTLQSSVADFSIYFYVIAFMYLVFILALKDYLIKCAILMKTIAKFIFDNPKILILIVLTLLYSLIIITLWALGLYSFCLSYANQTLTYGGFTVSALFWGFLLIFFNFYFYYTSVFLTSYALSIWFYQKQDADVLATPLKHLARYHMGTVTFASLILAFIYMVKFILVFAKCQKRQGICGLIGGIISICICCCVGGLEPFFQILNSYAVTMTALTGQSFIQSAKTIGFLAFDDVEAFSAFSLTGHVIRFGALVGCSSIPTIVGAILLTQNVTNTYLQIVGILLIMFCTSIIGMVILQTFIESIHTLFILYRLDTELGQRGHEVTWIEEYGEQLNKGFDQAFVGQIKKKPKPKYRKITTVVVHQGGYTQVYQQRVQVQPQQLSQNQIKP